MEEDLKFKIEKKYDTVARTIRISEPMEEQLEKLAAENGISFNALIIQCIKFCLEHLV